MNRHFKKNMDSFCDILSKPNTIWGNVAILEFNILVIRLCLLEKVLPCCHVMN